MPRIDGGRNRWPVAPRRTLRQQERHRAAPDQFPIGIGEQRAVDERMMMRVLDHQVGAGPLRAIEESPVERVAGIGFDADADALLSGPDGQRLHSAHARDELTAISRSKICGVPELSIRIIKAPLFLPARIASERTGEG